MSTNTGLSTCCISGIINTGQPSGREDNIGGLDVYVSEPQDKSTSKSIVFITDVFGWKLPNVRLLADDYAKAGFTCYVPDVHQGDSVSFEYLYSAEPPLKVKESESYWDVMKRTAHAAMTLPWLVRHREGVSVPIISGFINTVRQIPGTNKVGAIGFCWGGRHAILQTHVPRPEGDVGGVDAAYACHPSLVAIQADFDPVGKPLSIAVGTKDSLLDQKSNEQIKELLDQKSVPTQVEMYEDQIHGFALRSDWSSDKDKKAMDAAEKQGIEWFHKYLS